MEKLTQEQYGLYINGKWVPASDGATFTTRCPANGEVLATCAQATKEDVDTAVNAAWEAFKSWKNVTVNERAAILYKVADIIEQNAEHLAMVESMDNGKPIRETMTIDIPYSVRHFRYFAGCIMAEEGSANILDGTTLSLILREPIGVVGQIVPWNFPFLMAAWKLAPVLAAGCCTVFKPSSDTPLSVLELARLTQDVIPAGVFNVITGSGSKSGQYILDHPGFRKLAFTGSTEVGRNVALAAAQRLIPSPWSWAARAPTSISTTASGIWLWMASSWASCSTRARFAVPAPASSCRTPFMTSSWRRPPSASTPSRWACPGRRTLRWAPRSTRTR